MSIHTTTPPDDDRLAALIGEAFEALPAPDRWKLKEVEARLSRALTRKPQARRPSMWVWWLAGALIMGSAAAWWVYESTRDGAETTPIMQEVIPLQAPNGADPVPSEPAEQQKNIDASDGRPGTSADGKTPNGENKRRPLIYQRERY